MMDRETVITHLQIIHTWAEFARERDLQFFTAKHLEDIAQWADDAIVLLKEQQEKVHQVDTTKVKTVQRIAKSEDNGTYFTMIWYECEECGHKINGDDIFCAGCGKEVDRSKVVYWKKKPEEEKNNE